MQDNKTKPPELQLWGLLFRYSGEQSGASYRLLIAV